MLLFLTMLDSDEEQSKLFSFIINIGIFYGIWRVNGCRTTIWQRMRYRKHF